MCLEKVKDFTILIIEDDQSIIRLFERLLNGAGYRRVVSIQDSRQAVDSFLSLGPDLVLLDLHMPHLDGFQVMELLKTHVPEEAFLPIAVITGDSDQAVRIRCLSAGAKDFVSKPFRAEEFLLRVRNLLETRLLHRFLESRNQNLQLKVMEENSKVKETQLEVIQRLAVAAEYRDDVTGRHAERVGILAGLIGTELGLPEEEARLLRRASPLHDVGKIGIPDSILMKPAKLTDKEFETMKTHTTIGGHILSRDSFPILSYAKEIALSHHERWDGSGYPLGLAGEGIPLSGRIVSVADVFDSIVHERCYKPAFSVDEALRVMVGGRERQFDPAPLDLFVDLVRSGRVDNALSEARAEHPSDSAMSGPSFPMHEARESPESSVAVGS